MTGPSILANSSGKRVLELLSPFVQRNTRLQCHQLAFVLVLMKYTIQTQLKDLLKFCFGSGKAGDVGINHNSR